uniref:Leucokinin-6 n=1 Tax=Rhyparobia maderae TaxID=36963 RepID=LCK6_RHYMA|nr:RecName: Full=Leucokinin-6; AltName: Full=Leucokinin VI; Short=L-VI [Rhyparobia maderae]
QSSFHSWG